MKIYGQHAINHCLQFQGTCFNLHWPNGGLCPVKCNSLWTTVNMPFRSSKQGWAFKLEVDCIWNMMAHAQKPDFVFRRNERVHLNWQGRQFSRLLAAEVCLSVVVMLDTPSSEVVWRVLATHSIRQFSLHFHSRASPCAITFQLDSKTPSDSSMLAFKSQNIKVNKDTSALCPQSETYLLHVFTTINKYLT
jgi:hypothetical protein